MSQRRAEPPRRRRRRAGTGTQGARPNGPPPTGTAAPEAAAPDAAAPQHGAHPPAKEQDGSTPRRRPRRRRSRGNGGGNRNAAGAANPTGAAGQSTQGGGNRGGKAAAAAKPTGAAAGKTTGKSGKPTGDRAGKPTGKGPRKTTGRGAGADGRGDRKQKRTWMRRVDEFSAGGLVLDLAGDVPRGALIGRTDKLGRLLWSLPKGHIEEGETAEQAAVREVEEETGISGVIVGELGTIDFWFVADGRRIHKTVRHFLMRAVGGELSDADVEVTAVAWVPLPEISDQLAYPDERGLVETAGRMLAESA